MIIPSQSSLLLIGVNYASLILGTILSKAGVNILLIDKELVSYNKIKALKLDEYDISLLNQSGFILDGDLILTEQIQKQASRLLANSLCSILWGVKAEIIQSENNQIIKLSNGHVHVAHSTQYVFYGKDLLLNTEKPTLKNIAILSWKLEGFLSGLFNYKLLKNHLIEQSIVEDYYIEMFNKPRLTTRISKIFTKNPKGAIHLKESKINLHLSQFRGTEAGDLLPNLNVFDEKLKKNTSFYNWCKFGNFSMIMLGYISKYNLDYTARWIKSNYPIQLFYLPPTERNQHIFDFFNIIDGEKKTLLIRPDRFIGFINDRIDLDIISNYLSDLLLMNAQVKVFGSKEIGDGSLENYP